LRRAAGRPTRRPLPAGWAVVTALRDAAEERKEHLRALRKQEGAAGLAVLRFGDQRGRRSEESKVTRRKVAPGAIEYTEAHVGDAGTGGMIQIDEEMKKMGIKPHWMPYFAVADADANVKKAKSLGTKDSFGPHDILKVGRFAVLNDPFGARFAIIKPQM